MQNQPHTGSNNLYPQQQLPTTQSNLPNINITTNQVITTPNNNNNNNMMTTTSTPALYATTQTPPTSRPTTPSSIHHHHQVMSSSSSWPMNNNNNSFQQQHTFSNSNANVLQQHPQQQFRPVASQPQHGSPNYHIPQQQHNSVGYTVPSPSSGNQHHQQQSIINNMNNNQNMFNSLMQQQMNTNMMGSNNYSIPPGQPYNNHQLSSNLISTPLTNTNTNMNNNMNNNINGSNFQVMMGNQPIDTSHHHHHMQNNSDSLHSSPLHVKQSQQQQNQTPLQHQLQNSTTPTPTRFIDGDNIFSLGSFFRLSNDATSTVSGSNTTATGMKHTVSLPPSTPLSSTTTVTIQQQPPSLSSSVGSRVVVQNSTSVTPISFTTPTMAKVQNNTQPKWTIQQTTIVQPTLVKSETSPTNNSQPQVDTQPNEDDADGSQEAGQKGGIKITRNIRADTSVTPNEPVEYPKHGVLYIYNVENWTDKNSFYDKIAYSFGTPSTQKKVHCSYLNCKVMHYERTCQGVYYCPHKDDDGSSCIVRPCRLRFHTCQKHNNNSLTKSGKCPFKLHFYVPLDKADNRRLLLCLGAHNHPLLSESDSAIISAPPTEKKSKHNKSSSSILNLNQESKPSTPQNIHSSTGNNSTNASSYQETKQSMSRVSSSNSIQSGAKLKSNVQPNMMPPSGNEIPPSHKMMNFNQNPNNFIMNSMPNPMQTSNMSNMQNNMNSMPNPMSSNMPNSIPNSIPNNIPNNMPSGMPPNMMNNIPNSMPSNLMSNNSIGNMSNMPNMSTNNMMNMPPQNLMGNMGNSIHQLGNSNSSMLGVNAPLSNCYQSASDSLMNPPPKSTPPPLHNMASLNRSASQEILTSSIATGTGLTPPAHHHSSPLGRSPSLSPPYYSSPSQYSSNKSNLQSYPQSQIPSIQPSPLSSIGSSNILNSSTAPKKVSSLFQPSDYLQHVSKPPSYSKTTSTGSALGESDPKRSSSLMSSSPNFMSSSSPSLYSFSNSPSPRIDLSRSPSYLTHPTTPSPPHMLVSPMNQGFPTLSPSYFYDNPSPSYSSPQQTIPQSPSQLIYKTDTGSGIKRERLYTNDNSNTKKVKQEEDSVLPPIESIVD